jgi:hypothetical protein
MIPHDRYSSTLDGNLIAHECGDILYTPKLDTDS